MSEMEMFCGYFKKSDLEIEVKDEDDFYELEEEHGCHYVSVDGQLYEFMSIVELDNYGFSKVIPRPEYDILLCYWYNGGAGLHEVVEEAIRDYLGS